MLNKLKDEIADVAEMLQEYPVDTFTGLQFVIKHAQERLNTIDNMAKTLDEYYDKKLEFTAHWLEK